MLCAVPEAAGVGIPVVTIVALDQALSLLIADVLYLTR